ncbi:hypothetical protein [Pseudoalteromonas luteoviolacea]|uniref:Uncharacterized protein n=1 Tax=Pseudoalteromonas luteoviolacea DSM 6061 TaxID=1365250 RepID=A0A161ZT23_9GAMM|nr:hypothetical protein [Pseudoalteromonas luteoviolacea]KZN31649.1 hypothetical protein N475_04140 [Pseudoalteromonas luteoviolacea DSM 6061]KZN54508.1 hypothetical protein N474_01955 [Pseudoalteromonas luteoviolacea CPMOR-2]MBE0388982.1 hypothetical protein [Pseudoalteromonas luteoviolacea DSM 6061]TQF70346.1 hypothetical protein FLM44_04420 [Pseudoalteromonas luteoviolacea]
MKVLFAIFITFLSVNSYAMQTKAPQKIAYLMTWADYTGGVFKFVLENQDEEAQALCPSGYWLDGSSDKNAALYGFIKDAYQSKTPIIVYANEALDWDGMITKECKLQLAVGF